jgi:translation initiation factor IF-2
MGKLDKGLDLGFDAKGIGKRIKETAKKARNEEELKIKVESLIQELIAKFFEPISGKREDALYGTVIIEYKALVNLILLWVIRHGFAGVTCQKVTEIQHSNCGRTTGFFR